MGKLVNSSVLVAILLVSGCQISPDGPICRQWAIDKEALLNCAKLDSCTFTLEQLEANLALYDYCWVPPKPTPPPPPKKPEPPETLCT
jgi:hypothetical protein